MFVLYEIPLIVLAVYAVWEWGWKDRGFSCVWRRECGEDGSSEKHSLFMLLMLVWSLVTVVFYGWVGEKVPWLLIHQLFPILFLASYRMSGKKVFAGVFTVVFLLLMTMHVCFTPVDINEPIVQVQNSEDMREVMALIDSAKMVVVALIHIGHFHGIIVVRSGIRSCFMARR
jgi:uncharacterized protein (TIGR03663 family)